MSVPFEMFPMVREINMIPCTGACGDIVSRNTDSSLTRPDEYCICAGRDGTALYGADGRAVFYAEQVWNEFRERYGRHFIGTIHDYASIRRRIAMLDFKRISCTKASVFRHLREFARWRINACIMEYEDKFPYSFAPEIVHPEAFSEDDIKEINALAFELHIELIPLVQCFSHWEYILARDRFLRLRELVDGIQQACPLNPGVLELFRKMSENVIALHPYARSFHIGGDEARYLGQCPVCLGKVKKSGIESLYGDYLSSAASFIQQKGLHVFFWGDFIGNHGNIPQIAGLDCTAVDWSYEETSAHTLDGNTSFPHQRSIRSALGRVIGAGNIRLPDNIFAHVQTALENGNDGVIGTYWASSNSLSTPYSLLELRKAGAAMLGAAAWNFEYEEKHRDDFFKRFLNMSESIFKTADEVRYMHTLLHHFQADPDLELLREPPGMNPFSQKIRLERRLMDFMKGLRFFKDSVYHHSDLLAMMNSSLDFKVNGKSSNFASGYLILPPPGTVDSLAGLDMKWADGLVLYGGGYPGIFRKIRLPFKDAASALGIIQSTVGGRALPDGSAGLLRWRYRDGSEYEECIRVGDNIGSWYQIQPARRALVATVSREQEGFSTVRTGLHLFTAFAPAPDKELDCVELEGAESCVIALNAAVFVSPCEISGQSDFADESIHELDDIYEELAQCEAAMRIMIAPEVSKSTLDELSDIAFGTLRGHIRMLKRLVGGRR